MVFRDPTGTKNFKLELISCDANVGSKPVVSSDKDSSNAQTGVREFSFPS